MHEQAYNWIAQTVVSTGLETAPSVLDLGGRTVNGTIHALFHSTVTTVDIRPGEGVDIVADAATWTPDSLYDVVLCTEVFEHTPAWRDILVTAHDACRPGGILLATMASRDRPPHSAIDGAQLGDDPSEYYANIDPSHLRDALQDHWSRWEVVEADGYFGNDDLYCWAVK